MLWVVEWIRKAVVLVLLMEVVLQLQTGKQYESYLKMLVGVMVVYSLVAGIFDVFPKLEGLAPMKEFQWNDTLFVTLEEDATMQEEEVLQSVISTVDVQVEVPVEVSVERIDISALHVVDAKD